MRGNAFTGFRENVSPLEKSVYIKEKSCVVDVSDVEASRHRRWGNKTCLSFVHLQQSRFALAVVIGW